MMRALLLTVLSLAASRLADAADKKTELRTCLTQIAQATNPVAHRKKVEECYRLAEPGKDSSDLARRALFLESLSMYLEPSTWPDSYSAISQQLTSYYRVSIESDLTPLSLKNFDDDSLADFFRGISFGMFYNSLVSTDQVGRDREGWIFREMEARKVADSQGARSFYLDLLKEGEWFRARSLATRWPELGRLPQIRVRGNHSWNEPGYLTLSSDEKVLEFSSANFVTGPKIVFFGSCHFAIDAIEVLSGHTDLRDLMGQVGLVLGAPEDLANDGLSEILRLRKLYPEFEFHTMYKKALWAQRGFNVAYSPNIAFLLNGSIRFTAVGAGPNLVEQFCEGLRAIQIANTPACAGH